MMLFDATLKDTLTKKLSDLEDHFAADCAFYYGEIHPVLIKLFRDFIEKLPGEEKRRDRFVLLLNTPGGSAETVEKMVEIIRFHYRDFTVVVPDFAFSAGTILWPPIGSTWTTRLLSVRSIRRSSTARSGYPRWAIWTRSRKCWTKRSGTS